MVTIINIGERLKEVRIINNKTQKDVADELNINQAQVSRMERGIEIGSRYIVLFLDYYSKYINIDYLFGERFNLLKNDNIQALNRDIHIDSVIVHKSIFAGKEIKKIVDDIKEEETELKRGIERLEKKHKKIINLLEKHQEDIEELNTK